MIREQLQTRGRTDVKISYGSNPNHRKIAGTVMRWGSLRPLPDGNMEVINENNAISLAGNKLRSLEVMRDNGIQVPTFWKCDHQFHENPKNRGHRINEHLVGEDGTVEGIFFGRAKRHSRGSDIEIFHPTNKKFRQTVIGYDGSDYFVEYIPPKREYRIHVMDGQIILCQKKYFGQQLYDRLIAKLRPDGDVEYFDACAELVRNNETGWRFYDIQNDGNVPESVRFAALGAVAVHGLDFGAVDILWAGKERGAFVLEINTAPGLREHNLELYANNIIDTYMEDN